MILSRGAIILGELSVAVGITFEETLEPPVPVKEVIAHEEESLIHEEDISLVIGPKSLALEEDIAPAAEVTVWITDYGISPYCRCGLSHQNQLRNFPWSGFQSCLHLLAHK